MPATPGHRPLAADNYLDARMRRVQALRRARSTRLGPLFDALRRIADREAEQAEREEEHWLRVMEQDTVGSWSLGGTSWGVVRLPAGPP